MKQVRICIIGSGSMANTVHYPSLSSFNDVEIVGVSEMDHTRLDGTCDKFGIARENRYYAVSPLDYREMLLKLKPDGVYVIGQPHIMYDIWVWCLEKGFHLYIEKPMGMSMHQARSLLYLAEKNKCMTQVSHQRRTVPLLHKMRETLLEKGPVTHGVVEFYKCNIEPFLGARDHMLDDCTHSVDTARWICGGEVVRIESHCKRIGTPDINWIGATLHFDNGSTCFIINSWSSGRRVFRVQMHTPGGYTDAEVEGKAMLYLDGDYEGVEYDTRDVAGSDKLHVFGGFEQKNREFIDSLKEGKEMTSSPFRDTVKTMEICEKILAQALMEEE